MINITTLEGMPALRDGEFFRVRESSAPGLVRVELRRKRRFLGSVLVEYSVFGYRDYQYLVDAVTETARYVVKNARERGGEKLSGQILRATYAGDHYPERG